MTHHFIRENHSSHKLENVANRFRIYINNKLKETLVEAFQLIYQRYSMVKEYLFDLPVYDESKLESILQDFDFVNYVDESYFLYNVDLYLVNDYNQAMKIRKKSQFLFLLFYLSKKYNLKIDCIEEEISG